MHLEGLEIHLNTKTSDLLNISTEWESWTQTQQYDSPMYHRKQHGILSFVMSSKQIVKIFL